MNAQYFYYATGNAAAQQQAKNQANAFATALGIANNCPATTVP